MSSRHGDFAALGEFIREMIVQGTREGLDAAKARGTRLGRPPAMTAEQIQHAKDLLGNPDNTVSSIARLLGVSRATIYKYVPELPLPRRTGRIGPTRAALGRGRYGGSAGAADAEAACRVRDLPVPALEQARAEAAP